MASRRAGSCSPALLLDLGPGSGSSRLNQVPGFGSTLVAVPFRYFMGQGSSNPTLLEELQRGEDPVGT